MSENLAEKAAKAREAKEAAERAKREEKQRKKEARRENVSGFFGGIGHGFKAVFSAIFNCYVLLALFLIACAGTFVLEAVGASGSNYFSIVAQQVTFYISLALFLADLVIFICICNGTLDIDDYGSAQVTYGVFSAILGIALFVMGCVTLGMGRLSFHIKSTYYDEANGVVYAEIDTSYTVLEIRPVKEDVIVLSECDGLAVTAVHEKAAKGNSVMKTLTFAPGGNYTLNNECFANCAALDSISLGANSGFHIENRAFADCGRLAVFDCGTGNSVAFEGGEEVLKNCARLAEFRVNNSTVLVNLKDGSASDPLLKLKPTLYLSGGKISNIHSFGDLVIGKNSTLDLQRYYDLPKTCHFEEGFDFDGSTLTNRHVYGTGFLWLNEQVDYYPLAEQIYLPSSVTHIPDNFFGDKGTACTVYYAGTPEQWAQITIGPNGNKNYDEGKVTMNYNYAPAPSTPDPEG